MGLVIQSSDDEKELWQSSYSTFVTVQNHLKEAIAAEHVDQELRQAIDSEMKQLDAGLSKVPEFTGLVNWYKLHLTEINDAKRPDMIFHWWEKWTTSDEKDPVKLGGSLFMRALTTREEERWTPADCSLVLQFLHHFKSIATRVIDSERGLGWYQQLVSGLQYCIDQNMSAVFC